MNNALAICAVAATVLATASHSQPTGDRCQQPENVDRWEFEPSQDQAGVYEFRYYNNVAQCSQYIAAEGVWSSDERIRVVLTVVTLGANFDDMERVTLRVPDGYLAIPSQLFLADGAEPGIILVYPPMF